MPLVCLGGWRSLGSLLALAWRSVGSDAWKAFVDVGVMLPIPLVGFPLLLHEGPLG